MEVPRELNGFSTSQIDWETLWDNAVFNLFTTSDGRSQMRFYLDLSVEAAHFIQKYVEAYGGIVCRSRDDIDAWTVVLKHCPNFVNYGRPCFMLRYVTECMTGCEIRDINGYIINNSTSLCGVDLMNIVFYRKSKFSGKLVLDHFAVDETSKSRRRSEKVVNEPDEHTIVIGPKKDWYHEMADTALQANLADIEAREKVVNLKRMARSCGGSSFSVRVLVEPIGGSPSVQSTDRQEAKRRRRSRRNLNGHSEENSFQMWPSDMSSIVADISSAVTSRTTSRASEHWSETAFSLEAPERKAEAVIIPRRTTRLATKEGVTDGVNDEVLSNEQSSAPSTNLPNDPNCRKFDNPRLVQSILTEKPPVNAESLPRPTVPSKKIITSMSRTTAISFTWDTGIAFKNDAKDASFDVITCAPPQKNSMANYPETEMLFIDRNGVAMQQVESTSLIQGRLRPMLLIDSDSNGVANDEEGPQQPLNSDKQLPATIQSARAQSSESLHLIHQKETNCTQVDSCLQAESMSIDQPVGTPSSPSDPAMPSIIMSVCRTNTVSFTTDAVQSVENDHNDAAFAVNSRCPLQKRCMSNNPETGISLCDRNGEAQAESTIMSPRQSKESATVILPQPSCSTHEPTGLNDSLVQNESNSGIADIDASQEILSDFREFLKKKLILNGDALVERFKRKKLAAFVEKHQNTTAADKYKNIDRKALRSLRRRVQSMLLKKSSKTLALPPQPSNEIVLSMSKTSFVSFSLPTEFNAENDSDATFDVISRAPDQTGKVRRLVQINS